VLEDCDDRGALFDAEQAAAVFPQRCPRAFDLTRPTATVVS